jgi:D-glycero-alpha-D-manno-heptose-7-phosphate kinase
MSDIENFCVVLKSDTSLRECMAQIDKNQHGFVVLVDRERKALGTLTDGDIRRALLRGMSPEASPVDWMTKAFTYVGPGQSREQVLKLLDSRVKFIPVLEEGGRLARVITLGDVGYAERSDVTVRAKAPARISFGGGGTDLTPFFLEHGGAVLNATVNMYSRATLRVRRDPSVDIVSHDLGKRVTAKDVRSLAYDGTLDLVKAAVKLLKPDFGFELVVSSDFSPGSGLGGSSVVLAAVIGCFNQMRTDKLDLYDIAELAFQAERIELNCSGGWQDQYATVFGGFNFMEFRANRNEINTLNVPEGTRQELEERLILCYTGRAHPDRTIHDQQKANMVSEARIVEFAKRARDIAVELKSHLLRGHVDRMAELLHEGWMLKRNFQENITDATLDEIYDFARENGAAGGKLLGAGGGGFYLFQAKRDSRHALEQALKSRGYETHRFVFDLQGLRSWRVPAEAPMAAL